MVNTTEESVRADVARYEADPERFGLREGAGPVDHSHYERVEGYKNKGDTLRPGVKARFSYNQTGDGDAELLMGWGIPQAGLDTF